MALSSRLFRGDKKLEAAQESDPAHLTPGTKGPHVAKVQMALFALDSLAIDPGELRTETYGPSTARAVLAYKTKRQIINRAYQDKADDIVGKMTITRLDQDMATWEGMQNHKPDCRSSHGAPGKRAPAPPGLLSLGPLPAPTPLGSMAATLPLGLISAREPLGFMSVPEPIALMRAREPRVSITPPAARLAASNPSSRTGSLVQLVKGNSAPSPGALPQLNRALRIYCSVTTHARDDAFPIAQQLELARNRVFEYGMTLMLEFGGTSKTPFADTINFAGGLVLDEDVGLLRKASEDTRPGAPNVLRIIVCPRHVNQHVGETFRDVTIGNLRFPQPFVVLNSRSVAKDNSTLLHEMIHAAYPRREDSLPHDDERHSVFYKHPPKENDPEAFDRTWLKPERAKALANGFFARS